MGDRPVVGVVEEQGERGPSAIVGATRAASGGALGSMLRPAWLALPSPHACDGAAVTAVATIVTAAVRGSAVRAVATSRPPGEARTRRDRDHSAPRTSLSMRDRDSQQVP